MVQGLVHISNPLSRIDPGADTCVAPLTVPLALSARFKANHDRQNAFPCRRGWAICRWAGKGGEVVTQGAEGSLNWPGSFRTWARHHLDGPCSPFPRAPTLFPKPTDQLKPEAVKGLSIHVVS
jgi:hypothetical protein